MVGVKSTKMIATEYSSTVCMCIIGYFIFNVVTPSLGYLTLRVIQIVCLMDLQATKGLKKLCHNRLGLGSDSDGMFNITRVLLKCLLHTCGQQAFLIFLCNQVYCVRSRP